jgi:release factor glutamine methyltransferase
MVGADATPGRPAGGSAQVVTGLSVRDLLAQGAQRLGGDEARREAELLLGHALQRDRAWLFAHARDPVEPASHMRFEELIARRVAGEPVAYITAQRGFWTFDLAITPAVLVPRPETELLVETALQRLPTDVDLRVADLGTGSGAIALALAQERPLAKVVAIDTSHAALAVARANAEHNELANIEFREGSWYAPLVGERFDLIASNPPYVAEHDPHVTRGDLRFEPRIALTSGVDGLDAIRIIAAGAIAHLRPGGWLLIEHGFDQGSALRALFAGAGLSDIETRPDLEGRDRLSIGRRCE